MRANRPMLAPLAMVVVAVTLTACGGGGGGGGAGAGDPMVEMVTASGLSTPLWQASGGSTVPGGQCPAPVSLNSIIEFTFGGAVDVTSLPGWQGWVPGAPEPGPTFAQGSINITTTDGTTTTPATGTFAVVDDPSLPAGNRRRVRFLPALPSNPNMPGATSGLSGNTTFNVFLPRGGSGGQVVRAGGEPIRNEVLTCFQTCDPMTTAGSGCFTDPVPGPPHIVMTTPATGDPAPTAIDPASVQNNTISLFFNEPLFPQNIDNSTVRLLNASSGAQVPGSVTFFQAGTPQAGPNFARIDYVASSQLLASATYEIVLDGAQIQDFGSNQAVLYDPNDPNAGGQRLLQTISVPFCEGTPFSEDFTSTSNRESTVGVAIWDGSGSLSSEFPFDVVGDGTFGMLSTPTGSVTLDTDMPSVAGFADGVWNTTGVNIPAGSFVRLIGTNWQAHFRSLGGVSISGSLNGNAPNSFTSDIRPVPVGNPEQGAYWGRIRQGSNAAFAIVNGGVGGVGGGRGGNASQSGYNTRTPAAEDGFGPAFNGQLNTGPFGANPHYGGGDGGDGSPRGTNIPTDDRGGVGGAGGSAFTQGEEGRPLSAQTQGCQPLQTNQPISMPTPIPAAFMAPITTQSAGSGGGGGGDNHQTNQAPPNDHQGGGGGGGGGGLRISAIMGIDINGGAQITMNGGKGGGGSLLFSGHGGGGSGGQIWLQSFDRLNISSTARMTANAGAGGDRGTPCGEFDAGAGGLGLLQLEDSMPQMINTNFMQVNPTNLQIVEFPFSTSIRGEALSVWFDTGYGDPDYIATSETFSLGDAPGAMVTITYEGAFESLAGGSPDPATISQPVTGANIDQLDGFRFIRFRAVLEFDPPSPGGGGTNINNTLPAIQDISIRYETPLLCP